MVLTLSRRPWNQTFNFEFRCFPAFQRLGPSYFESVLGITSQTVGIYYLSESFLSPDKIGLTTKNFF